MFLNELNTLDIKKWREISVKKTERDVLSALRSGHIGLNQMAALLSPTAENCLEQLAVRSQQITIKRFGRTIQLYTPVYLSNFCNNSCLYCGFRAGNSIKRKIQAPDSVEKEAEYLHNKGFKNILLVAGDDPRVNIKYLTDVIKRLHKFIPSISLEIAPRSVDEYKQLKEAGAEGVVIFQETYNKNLYRTYHPTGKKSDYTWRIETPERIGAAGFHRIGIGALLGLNDYLYEGIALFAHAKYLLKHFWKNQVTINLPRIRKAEGAISPPEPVNDRQFTQLICALRIALPDVGIVLSTREEPRLRDGLIKIGVTHISAGSRTEPGGYLSPDSKSEQFSVEDRRSPAQMAERLKAIGYDPVWKDWEKALNDSV